MSNKYSDFSGCLVLDKPKKITSFQAVYRIKKTLNVKKCGHCGTLDPLATGLLIVLTGKATKLQEKFMKKDKVYSVSFLLGTTSNTGDLDGILVKSGGFSKITFKEIENAAKKLTGEILQIPPMFSALRRNGIRLYKLARQGIEVERNPRKVTVKRFEIMSFENGIVKAEIECSSGTYIRTIVQDFGKYLKCGAVVTELRRERIGIFKIEDAMPFEETQNIDNVLKRFLPIEKLGEAEFANE